VRPADIIEEIWVRDFVDWDVRRYRRLKDALMAATAYEGLRKVIRGLRDPRRCQRSRSLVIHGL
jgi:hypothetical protein